MYFIVPSCTKIDVVDNDHQFFQSWNYSETRPKKCIPSCPTEGWIAYAYEQVNKIGILPTKKWMKYISFLMIFTFSNYRAQRAKLIYWKQFPPTRMCSSNYNSSQTVSTNKNVFIKLQFLQFIDSRINNPKRPDQKKKTKDNLFHWLCYPNISPLWWGQNFIQSKHQNFIRAFNRLVSLGSLDVPARINQNTSLIMCPKLIWTRHGHRQIKLITRHEYTDTDISHAKNYRERATGTRELQTFVMCNS